MSVVGEITLSESVVFKEFAIQFPYLSFELMERFPPARGGAIEAAYLRTGAYRLRLKVAFRFEAMKDGVEGARAQLIPMMGQFLDDAQSEDSLFGGMMEDMKADEATDDVTIYFRYRHAVVSMYPKHPSTTAYPSPFDVACESPAADHRVLVHARGGGLLIPG
jgi:hypothetical protein